MKICLTLSRLILLVWLACGPAGRSEAAEATVALSANPVSAWADLERGYGAMRPPTSWQGKTPRPGEVTGFQKLIRTSATTYAAKAKEFINRFPTNEHVGDVRVMVVFFLNHAVAAGDLSSEEEITTYVDATIANLAIPELDRVAVFLMAGNVKVFKEAGMRYFSVGPQQFDGEIDQNDRERLGEAIKLFPKSEYVFRFVIGMAQRYEGEDRKELLTQVIKAPSAPDNMKQLAQHLLAGTKPYQLGKPIELKFKSLDGPEVDLAALKDKVVLIHFWSTEIPASVDDFASLKEVYTKLRDHGLEIIGVNLDTKEAVVRRVLKEKGVTWPQQFEGKGWANGFAVRYAVLKAPTLWLVDKSGNLRLSNVLGNTERMAEFFLGQRGPGDK
jgi:thiol-disulfide isomerase/thioredoxin